MNAIRALLGLAIVALLLLSQRLVHGQPASWWDARWNRRCELTFRASAVALLDVPVVVRGSWLKRLAGDEPFSVASLRVVGPLGEIPCQFDQCDRIAHVRRAPDHLLHDEDELAFQVDLPAAARWHCWLYWSTAPLPPGRYPSRTMMGAAMEPAGWQHDIQLWNDLVMAGLRGPARGDDPTKNQIDNWGAGSVVRLEVMRIPILRIQQSWGSIFPRGAWGSSPSREAAAWQRPQELLRGPVRVAAVCRQHDAGWKTRGGSAARVDVEHRLWLYEHGATLCFDEEIFAHDAIGPMQLRYDCELGAGQAVGTQLWYSRGGKPQSFSPTEDQVQQSKRGRIVLSQSEMDPWMAGYWPDLKKGYAYFLDAGEGGGRELRQASCYVRGGAVLRYQRTIDTLPAGRSLLQRFWVVGIRGEAGPATPLATWLALKIPPMQFGPVERRGAP